MGWRWHLPRYVAILDWPPVLLGRLSHGSLKQCLIVSPRLNEFLIELLKVVLFLRVLSNELNQLWPDCKGAVVELRDLFVVSNIQVATARAEQCQ